MANNSKKSTNQNKTLKKINILKVNLMKNKYKNIKIMFR